MSDFRYEFHLSIGYYGAEHVEEVDLVDDLDFNESYLEGLSKWDLQDVVRDEADSWASKYIEVSAERLNG